MVKLKEIWRPIKDYEGSYEVSNLGRVRSLPRLGYIKKKIEFITSFLDRYGYYYVALTKNCITKKKKVHRLVAIAFIPNPENKPQVNHKWGIKTDNRVSELEWATASEQQLHSIKVLKNNLSANLPQDVALGNNPKAKIVLQFTKEGVFIKEFDSCASAAIFLGNARRGNISSGAAGRQKTAYGFVWKYKNKKQ